MNIKNRFIFLVAETGLTLTLWPGLGRAPPRRWERPGSLSLPPPPGSAGGWPAACWPSCPSAYSRSWCGTPWHCQRNLPVKRLHGLMSIYQKLVTNFMSKLIHVNKVSWEPDEYQTKPQHTFKKVGNYFEFVLRDDIFSIISRRPVRRLTMYKKSCGERNVFLIWFEVKILLLI